MAYDEQLEERVNRVLAAQEGVVQKKMFGGLAFMVNGNMSVGIDHERLMVRVGPEGYAFGLDEAHCRPMDITGRPMRGFIIVEAEGISIDEELANWVDVGVAFALSLPASDLITFFFHISLPF